MRTDEQTHEALPDLAESWEVSADQKIWKFKLRQGLKWSNGENLNADDVVFSMNKIYDAQNVIYPVFHDLRRDGFFFQVSKIDDLTVQVTVNDAYALFVEQFSRLKILPKHKFERAVAALDPYSAYQLDSRPEDIVGSGPFRVKAFQPGKFVLLERNPFYCAVDTNGTPLPYFDEILINQAANENQRTSLFFQRKIDALDWVRPAEYERVKAETGGRFSLIDLGIELDREVLCFNQIFSLDAQTQKPVGPFVEKHKLKWFTHAKFRKAVSCAIHREQIIQFLYHGRAAAPLGFVSPANAKWVNTNITQYPYDPINALRLLSEIGITNRDADGILKDTDGHRIEFTLTVPTGNDLRTSTAARIADDLRKIGMKVEPHFVDFQDLQNMLHFNHGFECALFLIAVDGVTPFYNVLPSSGSMHLFRAASRTEWEARIDKLIAAQMRAPDFPARKKLFDEVQSIMADQLPLIYTVTRATFAAVSPEIGNLRPSNSSKWHLTWNAEELYFKTTSPN